MPSEFARPVLDLILDEIGDEIRLAGFHALNSLRLEKAFRSFGHDIGDEDTPYEAGLGFAVALDKPGGFIGRDALLRTRDRMPGKRLVQFRLLDPGAAPAPRRADRDGWRPDRPSDLGRLRPHA